MRISLILTLDYTSWEHQSLTKLICVNSKFTWWVKSSCGCRVEIESHLPTYLLPSPISSKSQPSISSWWAPSCFQIWEISLSLSLSPPLLQVGRRPGAARRAQRAARRAQRAPRARPGAARRAQRAPRARPSAPSARPGAVARGGGRLGRRRSAWAAGFCGWWVGFFVFPFFSLFENISFGETLNLDFWLIRNYVSWTMHASTLRFHNF